ncbi:MAG: amino acid adenylation domain-containing protein, partial [Clostridiales bacterium]
VAYFKTRDELDDLMLIVIHHLVVDAVSWRILFDDLQLSLKQYLQGKEIHLPYKTSSYKTWAEKLIDYSRNNEFIDEVKYWEGILSKDYPEIPRDNKESDNFESSACSLSVSLSKDITTALLSKANDAFRTDINDLLLTALTRSFSNLTGKSRLLINLEAHGRDFAFEDIDVSRTVGWFTNLYPAALDLEGIYETSEAIKTVKEQLRQIPEKGRNFGIIKYLSEDIDLRKTFEDLKEPEIIFNYLGQFNSSSSAQDEKTSGSFNISSLPKGKESGDENRRQALIDINGGVYNGQLQFEWSYSNKIHNEATIKEASDLFIKELENIAGYCTSAEVGSLSPSDLKKYNVDEETFKKIEKALKDSGIKGYEVEDIYPLSPMQQGMLFHSQLSMGSGTYIEQLSSFFIGNLDPQAFMKAWTSAVENHTILRTLFITRGLDEPLQVVKKSIEVLPLEIIDLSPKNGENYDEILNEIKKSEVERGFDYLKAPLFRIKLIKLEEEKYQFIWTYHHILLDGWSVPLLLQEIFAAYESLIDKKQLPAAQKSSYGEYISWLKHQDIKSAEKFWRDYLSGVEEPTYLPTKKLFSGRSVKEGEIETLEMELSKELTNKLQSLLSSQSLTMNSLIQCIWAIILNKYSLNDDVIFGSTVSGRPSDLWGSENMLGLFINTLPVRIKFDKDLSVIDWLKSVQKDQLLMRQFEYSPLTEIQNWSDIPRTKQLFETILVYENFPVKEFLGKEKGSLEIQKVQSSEKTNYPITLVAGQSDKLMLRILYDSSLFDNSAVKRIFSQMKRLLEEIANCPEKKLSELPYLPDEELNKLLKEWNDTTRSLPEFMTIHQMFENQVKKTPEAQALFFNGESLSYRQLNARANKLANYLRQIGAKNENLVGLYIDRSSEMIIGMLAILKAGCSYLPLDPKLPIDRLQFMADESSLRIILTKKTIIESKPLSNSAFICFDTDSDLIDSQPDENLSLVVHQENLAYVIYTSGTTGRPKGVMVQHKGIINLALHYAESLSLGEGKKLFQFFSFSFDGSIVEIFCSLISGTTLYIPDAETAMPGPKMVKYLNENKIDKVTFSPSVLSVLPGEELNHIDAIIAGGEALSFDVVRKWFNRENLTFINAYGPTESTVCVSCFSMTSLPDFSDIIPIGRPLPNFRLYILDKNLNPAAIGVPGEVFVEGIGLARGYLNKPDLTAERFIPDPFLEGQRLYRTGDVARYREDGCIEFLGRNDDQVKLRGFRIELGEIESAALNSDALQSAAALIISEDENAEGTLAFTDKINLANKDRDKQLVLFYVPNKKSQDMTSAQIKDFIKKRLPEYMIPSKFVQLDMLPLNNSGKIDKKALISNLKQKDENSHEKRISLPQTLSEQLLLSLWKDLLKKETISTNDNFFELGGHSLIVTQLASRIIDAFGVEIALNRLFELTTIKQQASEIDLQKSESKLKETLIIKPVERNGE